jgi:hypothetical protein
MRKPEVWSAEVLASVAFLLDTSARKLYLDRECGNDKQRRQAAEALLRRPVPPQYVDLSDPRYQDATSHFRMGGYEWMQARSAGDKAKAKRLFEAVMAMIFEDGPEPAAEMLLECLNTSSTTITMWAVGAVNCVAERSDQRSILLRTLYRGARASGRARMIQLLCFPIEKKEFIMEGLRDRSAMVRQWACQSVDVDLMPDAAAIVRGLAKSDPAASVRESAEFTLTHRRVYDLPGLVRFEPIE